VRWPPAWESVRVSRERVCIQAISREMQKLIAEAGNSSLTEKKGNVRRWKPLPSNDSENVTVDTSLCVIVIFTSCALRSPINPITNLNPVYGHTVIVWQCYTL
jgi:hypothetical protein